MTDGLPFTCGGATLPTPEEEIWQLRFNMIWKPAMQLFATAPAAMM